MSCISFDSIDGTRPVRLDSRRPRSPSLASSTTAVKLSRCSLEAGTDRNVSGAVSAGRVRFWSHSNSTAFPLSTIHLPSSPPPLLLYPECHYWLPPAPETSWQLFCTEHGRPCAPIVSRNLTWNSSLLKAVITLLPLNLKHRL